jgi:uncharacterized phage infection (PIP) family protein YhgE
MQHTGTHTQSQRRGAHAQSGKAGQSDYTRQAADQTLNLAELAIRGTSVLLDIQLAALRNAWQLQARSAAAFGAPDYSDFLRQAESGTQNLLSASAEQMLASARQASNAIDELRNQFGQIVEQGTLQLSDEIRHGIEEMGQRAVEGIQSVKQLAQQGLPHNGDGQRRPAQQEAANEPGTAKTSASPRKQRKTAKRR